MANLEQLLERIQKQIAADEVRLTIHAQQEMTDESIKLSELYESLTSGQILENYPDHPRGSCCLIGGSTVTGRPLHVVCTTGQPVLIIITAYEPMPPKWLTPTTRRPRP